MSAAQHVFWKVTAFVTRPSLHLLCFEHPTAGRQLPAGGVEPGETNEAAVYRELLVPSSWRCSTVPRPPRKSAISSSS
ncbi:MAG: NUDIX domain-containing protein [Myxococcales bacterium]|nr:NUDIX domain-containing protein [Myxococcales bacterium]